MIEMVYKGKDGNGNDEKKLPKNVRQIGEAGKGKKIYLEDYAVTYLHQIEAAVLVGERWEKDGVRYIFIHGAIQVSDPEFGDEIWEDVYRDAREYFGDSEILGWAMQVQEQPEASDKRLNQIFKAHFDREDMVLLLYEEAEKEDTVFAEENGALKKAGGYYVYYDKNKSMQEYMIRKNEGKSVEKEQVVADKAIKNFRKRSEEKKDKKVKEKETAKQPKNVRFLYVASTFLVLTIMVIAVTMINNYDKMKNMEQALSNMAMSTDMSVAANASVQEEADDVAEGAEAAQAEAKETSVPGTENPGGMAAGLAQDGKDLLDEAQSGTALTDEANMASQAASVDEANTASQAASSDGGNTAAQAASTGETQSGTSLAAATEARNVGSLPVPGMSVQDTADAGKDAASGAEEAASGSVRPQQASYTVKDGDTLMDICRMYYGTDEKLEELCTVNNITDPNSIVPGQKIKLP